MSSSGFFMITKATSILHISCWPKTSKSANGVSNQVLVTVRCRSSHGSSRQFWGQALGGGGGATKGGVDPLLGGDFSVAWYITGRLTGSGPEHAAYAHAVAE
jgi:hypothetical protein